VLGVRHGIPPRGGPAVPRGLPRRKRSIICLTA
jgi:hypothetical protein